MTRLEQLLEEPALGLKLVAGAAGVRERGPVTWAHISEIPDPTPWLEGGEVLLTTGLAIKDSPRLQRRLVAGLAERGCTAVGFGVGIWLDDPPAALVDEADRRRLPLFTVPYEVPFIAVTRQVSRKVFAEHYANLRRAVDLHRTILAAVVSGAGIEEVVGLLARAAPGSDVIVFDVFGHTLALGGPTMQAEDAGVLWKGLVGNNGHGGRTSFDVGGRVASSAPVRVGDQAEAILVLVTDTPLDEAGQLLMGQGLAGLGLELARKLSVRESRRATVSDLYEEALAGRVSHDVLASRLRRLNIDPDKPFRVLAAQPPPRATTAAMCAVFEDVRAGGTVSAVGYAGGLVHALVQPADLELATMLEQAAAGRGWPTPAMGRSRIHFDVDGLAVALREAAVAARHGGPGLCDVDELGVRGLLAGAERDVAAQAFVGQILGPLRDHDDGDSNILVDSLRAYLSHGCRPGPAAGALHVHRHTLTYRLERIAQLTGRDPRSGEHLVAYGLALELTRGPSETP